MDDLVHTAVLPGAVIGDEVEGDGTRPVGGRWEEGEGGRREGGRGGRERGGMGAGGGAVKKAHALHGLGGRGALQAL